ncbi:MAG: CocE/NonD family hydrolase [Bacteroidales bacterium]|nr:CocE/NonD family hydrolase [Bacteroidales bacterium]
MKRLFFLSIVFLFAASLGLEAQSLPERDYPHSEEYLKEHYTKREVDIRMRDGVKLHTIIYEPVNNAEKHPIMMTRTCYNAGPTGETFNWGLRSLGCAPYIDAEYILVYQDVRGKWHSEGDFEDIRPFKEGKKLYKKEKKNIGQTDEASDTYDTVEWLIKNTNNNGNVGVQGLSYPGFYATMAALSGHPALKAVSPQAPATDWYHGDDVHHNGAFMQGEMLSFLPFFEYVCDNKRVRQNLDYSTLKLPELFHKDLYGDYMDIATYRNMCEAYGDSLTYLRIVREHPNWDQYWIDHTVTEGHLHDVKPAVMIVGGLFDKEDCFGAFATYKGIKEQSPETELYLVEGPWQHGGWSNAEEFWNAYYVGPEATGEYYVYNIEYPFFRYYLEGKGEKPAPGARIYDSGTHTWTQYEAGWPCKEGVKATPFYFTAEGGISTSIPSATTAKVTYVSDPKHPVPYRSVPEFSISPDYMIDDQRFASQRPDVLTFQTDVLTDTLQLAGEVSVDLAVDISTTDADFIVKIIDVYPDDFSYAEIVGDSVMQTLSHYVVAGYQLLVRGEVMRGKFRESFADPKPFEPGKVTRVAYTMPDVAHSFLPGHRLMIQVQSSWFPLVDRNPQTFCDIYTCDESVFQKSTINIHCERDAASYVTLPVVN